MGDKTLNERVLDLEQAVINLNKFSILIVDKIAIYDKYVIKKKAGQKRAEKARRAKEKYRKKKLGL